MRKIRQELKISKYFFQHNETLNVLVRKLINHRIKITTFASILFMSILIISATSFEVKLSPLLRKRKDINLAISGVGCAPTVYSILKAMRLFEPQMIIQAGIAGSFDKNLTLGKVVAVEKDVFGDLGVMENNSWKSVFEMDFINPNKRPFKKNWLENPNKRVLSQSELPSVSAVTVNEITTNKQRIRLLQQQGASVESMEGAALHYVGIMEKIPFLQVRTISNFVGERNKSKWDLHQSIKNLNVALDRIICSL